MSEEPAPADQADLAAAGHVEWLLRELQRADPRLQPVDHIREAQRVLGKWGQEHALVIVATMRRLLELPGD